MLSRYHIKITKEALGGFFSPLFLRDIWRANVRQDTVSSFFGHETRRHACDCRVAESLAYIDEEQALIAGLSYESRHGKRQRAALGRLLHTVQDIYAHTTYVALAVEQGTLASTMDSGVMDGLDPSILEHPALRVSHWDIWREPLYYVPLVGRLLRRVWLPVESHEAINLDSPKRGVYFDLAIAVARQRTVFEYRRAAEAIRAVGGMGALAQFHGVAEGAAEEGYSVARDEWLAIPSLAEAESVP